MADAGPSLAREDTTSPGAGPSPEHLLALQAARARLRPIRRTAAFAALNAWMLAVAAAVCFFGGLASPVTLALAVALAVAAAREFRARRLLLRLDERAPMRLAVNQALVAAAVSAYCAWRMVETLRGRGPGALAAAEPELASFLAADARVISLVVALVFGAVIAVTLLVQSLAAWHYLSRRRRLADLRRATPGWILDAFRRGDLG